ncbi:MAG: hypothetical protein LUQ62_03250 [Methanomicrobiales archaeon]|nr:hypothetical protein [Methanomicrobiales archaeon]
MDVTGALLMIGIGLVVFVLGLLAGYLATKTWFRNRSPKAAEKGAEVRPAAPGPTRRGEDS